MNELPGITICGEWPDAWGNYAPMIEHNRKQWMLMPWQEIAVWRHWFSIVGTAWSDVEDIEAELDRS